MKSVFQIFNSTAWRNIFCRNYRIHFWCKLYSDFYVIVLWHLPVVNKWVVKNIFPRSFSKRFSKLYYSYFFLLAFLFTKMQHFALLCDCRYLRRNSKTNEKKAFLEYITVFDIPWYKKTRHNTHLTHNGKPFMQRAKGKTKSSEQQRYTA